MLSSVLERHFGKSFGFVELAGMRRLGMWRIQKGLNKDSEDSDG
jgi:hypothetical protein